MSAAPGIVIPLVDKKSGWPIDHSVVHALAALCPAPHHLETRSSLEEGPDGAVSIAAYAQALDLLNSAGFDAPWMVLGGGLEEGYQKLKGAAYLNAMPNAPLGYKGNPLLNPYIEAFAEKAVTTLTALKKVRRLPKFWFLWNEGNEDSSTLRPGQVPHKGQSLAPEVFGAFLATVGTRIKQAFPDNVDNPDDNLVLIPGSLSCLERWATDPDGPWVGGYLELALAYINKHGVVAPYLFESVSLNLEGLLTDTYLIGCAKSLKRVMTATGLSGITVIGECGEENHDLVGVDWTPSFTSLYRHFSVFFIYCLALDPEDYGLLTVGLDTANKTVTVRAFLPFYAQVQKMLADLYDPASTST